MTKVCKRIEVYQCIRSGYHPDKPQYRRIASLPDADDELEDFLKQKYQRPDFNIRIVTEIF